VPALRERLACLCPGDTDLAWGRLTPWRALLAAALDEPFDPVVSGYVSAERGNPSAVLLAAWLRSTLGVDVAVRTSKGPGITEARLRSARGYLAITRPDGERATLSRPGQPDRRVALKRRTTADLLAEELRHLDADEVYAATLAAAFPGRMSA
jgi:glucose-6-phosphate dehydrogenase assembly protein OpcA